MTEKITAKITYVKDLDLSNIKCKRGGVILYTVYNNDIYIGLGIDSKSHDLTDFAGTICYKYENIIEGSLREFNEETLGIFQKATYDMITDCVVVYEKDNFAIFVPIDYNPNTVSKIFNKKYQLETEKIKILRYNNDKIKDPEVCGITWLSIDDFKNAVNDNTGKYNFLYYRLKYFLRHCGNFYELL